MDIVESYDRCASDLCERYESLSPEDIYAPIAEFFPRHKSCLDVGAGSGRDAAWLAARGNRVVAAEPSNGMLMEAVIRHPEASISWIVDRLPELTIVTRIERAFEFVLLAGVWMHIEPRCRRQAFATIASLVVPGGRLVVTLRLGTPDPDRTMYEVSADEVRLLARAEGMHVEMVAANEDRLGRDDVRWESMVLRKGSLPTARAPVRGDAPRAAEEESVAYVGVR